MSLKQEIETWVTALAAYDNNEFDTAIKCFNQIADTSKILFNCGVIYATLGEHAKAVACYQRAVQLDQYLAVAYFQQGVSNFLTGEFEEALANFNDALLYLRGNKDINYEQLGLKFKLYSCEVLFNRGLCYIYLQQEDAGMQDLSFALREKVVSDHDVIDEAIREHAEGYTVFSIPVGVVYRPNEAKVKNLKAKDYLGKARLVAEQVTHSDPRRQAAIAAMGLDDRPQEKLSYAALNLVRPDLRSRQQSEPPLRRNIFPPTPPPELERPDSAHGRRRSIESMRSERSTLQQARPAAKALRLELGAAAFDQSSGSEKPRIGTKRSESERPRSRREYTTSGSYYSRVQDTRSSQRTIPEVRVQEDPIEAYSQEATTQPQPQPQTQTQTQSTSTTNGYHHQRNRSSAPRTQPIRIEEEDEDEGDIAGSPSDSPLAFEIIPPKQQTYQSRHRSQSRRAPELRKVRIKVHAEDMRYVMTVPTVTMAELSEQIRTKFSISGAFKLKIKDEEGDLVTVGDQDDLDMAMGVCRAAAAVERADMGKMEMWLQEV